MHSESRSLSTLVFNAAVFTGANGRRADQRGEFSDVIMKNMLKSQEDVISPEVYKKDAPTKDSITVKSET